MSERADTPAQARVVLATHSDLQAARALARTLVEQRLAACVNVLGGALSVYRWNDAVEEAHEALLVVKTAAARIDELEREFRRLHPYDTPEWVVLAPQHVEPRYLAWLLEQTR